MEFSKEKWKEAQKALQTLTDFVLKNVDDPQHWVVQKNLNAIDELYWECINH